MKRIVFYATGEDLKSILRRVEDCAPLKFVPTGKRAEPNRPIYLRSADIPNVGIASNWRGSASTRYIVSLRDTKNVMYRFKSKEGDWRWLLSNGDNPETVLLTIAGLWRTGTLLPGEICTMRDTPVAQQIMRKFYAAFQQERFASVGIYLLGREALDMLKRGRRLSQSDQSPPEFDLKLTDGFK